MTLLLVFHASDGLLLLADGRRTKDPGEGNGDPFIFKNDARKTAIAPTERAVAMAAGHSEINGEVVADIFAAAMARAMSEEPDTPPDDGTYWSPVETGSVEHLSRACFEALRKRWAELQLEGRATWGVVAGYDPEGRTPTAYRFVVGNAGAERPTPVDVAATSILAIPLCSDEDIGHLVRSRFGLMTPLEVEQYFDRIEEEPDLPWRDSYTLFDMSLEEVFAQVTTAMPELIMHHWDELDSAGVGGDWIVYLLPADGSATKRQFAWGPTRPVGSPA